MLTFTAFAGINNVLPANRLEAKDLTEAINVDIGLSGEVARRGGFTQQSDECHKNLWQADGFMLATNEGVLVAFDDAGTRTIHPALGTERVWYLNLPDGRTAFSNGQVCGITDGQAATAWGVPTPDGVGVATSVAGALHAGKYRYLVTHVRLADGLEGAPAFADLVDLPDGGLLLTGLPALAGHAVNVYLSGKDGDECYLAGTTMGTSFSYLGANDALQLACRTQQEVPPPAGRCLAFWRGRALTAVGSLLVASQPSRWEAVDPRRDYKRFDAPITLVQPVDDGLFVGTEKELIFLAGTQFDTLVQRSVMRGAVVLGSGCAVPGDQLSLGGDPVQGDAMVCIAAGHLVGGYGGGLVRKLAQYRTAVTEVAATFRLVDGIPQYLAVAQ